MTQPPDQVMRLPPPRRRLRLGMVGGGQGAFIGEVDALGARISNRCELVAGCLSSQPEVAKASGRDWLLPEDRIYSDYRAMAAAESAPTASRWSRAPPPTAPITRSPARSSSTAST